MIDAVIDINAEAEVGVRALPERLMDGEDIALVRDLAKDRDTTPGEDALIEELLAERDVDPDEHRITADKNG
jgi:hypothetical protein